MNLPNLACHDDQKPAERDAAVAQMVSELSQARIRAVILDGDAPNSEVPGSVHGYLSFWQFERAWRYWVCKGPGLPLEVADKLHATHGTQVRVAGHCGCPSPREWYKGFPVPDYHVDTQEGLNALADAIRSVYDAEKDPDAKPYSGSAIKEGMVTDYRSKKQVVAP